MGRKKKNIIGLNELEELNQLHNMVDINKTQDSLTKLETNVVLENNNNLLKDDTIKKKRGRKKKISNTELSSSLINKEETILLENSQEKNNNNVDSDENNNLLLKELLVKQLKNICPTKKLLFSDIKRISKFLNESIFNENKCSLWHGYITNEKNQTKGTYINFYFNKKKIALHRLLYINYIGEISNDEYIKFSCENKGKCCSIHHMKKYSYNKYLNQQNEIKDYNVKIKDTNHVDELIQTNEHNNIHININKGKLTIEF